MSNPWNLPKGQTFALQALVDKAGNRKAAAAFLGLAESTIDEHANRARHKMGARTRFEALIMWDRWVRDQE